MEQTNDSKKALLELGWLKGDQEGCAETLGDPDGELGGPVKGTDEGLDEGPLLELGLLEGDEESRATT
jgi:hypothetical protein